MPFLPPNHQHRMQFTNITDKLKSNEQNALPHARPFATQLPRMLRLWSFQGQQHAVTSVQATSHNAAMQPDRTPASCCTLTPTQYVPDNSISTITMLFTVIFCSGLSSSLPHCYQFLLTIGDWLWRRWLFQ